MPFLIFLTSKKGDVIVSKTLGVIYTDKDEDADMHPYLEHENINCKKNNSEVTFQVILANISGMCM